MRGWIASIIQWFRQGVEEGSAQLILDEFVEAMTVEQLTERQLAIVNNLLPEGASPRLQAYLESQGRSAMITPWAIFRDA